LLAAGYANRLLTMSERAARMARSSLVVMAAFVAAKLVGLLRERAIAHAFGASPEYDAYVAAFRIPDLLFTLIAGGALVTAFLPVFAGSLAKGDRQEAWTVSSGVTNLALAVTAVLAGLGAASAPWLVAHAIAPGFDAPQQALTAHLMRVILIGTLVFSVSGVQMGILNAFHHFLLPALAPVAYNAGILFGALWLAPRFGVTGLAYGVVLGAVLHLLVKVPGLVHYGFRWFPVLAWRDPGVRRVLWLMWPRVVAMGTVQAVFVVNTRLASGLTAGSLSALNYAWVLAQIPETLLGTAVGTVALPTLAEQAALHRLDEFRRTATNAVCMLVAASLPASVALWVLGGAAIGILLQTGRFGAGAASATLAALQMFAVGLVGQVALEVVARVFYARQDTITPMGAAALAMAVNIALALALVGPMGHPGLALANSVAVTFEVLVCLWLAARAGVGLHIGQLGSALVRSAAAAAAMAACMVLALRVLPPVAASPLVDGALRAALGGAVGALAYVVAAMVVGLTEVRQGMTLAWQAIRRS
jgi:putative peptidoglycan lipid II flippase